MDVLTSRLPKMILDKKLNRSESLVSHPLNIFVGRHIVQEPYLRWWIARAEYRAFPGAELPSVQIGAFLVVAFDWTIAVGATRCTRWKRKYGYGDFKKFGG